MASLAFKNFTVSKERLAACMYDDLYATYAANNEVKKVTPFRDAYVATAEMVKKKQINRSNLVSDFALAQSETLLGMKAAQKDMAEVSLVIKQNSEKLTLMRTSIFKR